MDYSPSATRQPKQARAIRTRERILDQAEEVFAAKGFEAASLTSDILDPAGISVGSFYHQFSDKRAVLHALLDERSGWREVNAEAEASAGARVTLSEAVLHGMSRFMDDIDAHPAMWWIHWRELHSADAEILELIERSWASRLDAIRSILEQRVDDPGARTPGRLAFATSGLTGVLRTYLCGDDSARRDVRDQLDDVVAACVGALTA
jgi:AcrR family transcriptional regulator